MIEKWGASTRLWQLKTGECFLASFLSGIDWVNVVDGTICFGIVQLILWKSGLSLYVVVFEHRIRI
jgi:hypothetical protein